MQTAGSGPDSPSTATFLMLLVTASGHPGNLGLKKVASRDHLSLHLGKRANSRLHPTPYCNGGASARGRQPGTEERG